MAPRQRSTTQLESRHHGLFLALAFGHHYPLCCPPALVFGKPAGKAGFSPWWVLFAVVPIVNIVMLWVFAYAKWPAFPDS